MFMKKKLRILIVGCGYFGQKRIEACKQLPRYITIAGFVDTNSELAKKTGDRLHAPFASSITQCLKKTTANVAIVATPNIYHASLVCEALKNGLHVLCEKPLTTSVKDAKKIIMFSKKYRKFVKTGSNHRYFPTIQKAAEFITQGKIGRVLLIKGDIGTNGSHTKNSWFWNKNISGGGTFIDNAPHLLDITRWLMGDFSTCVGSTTTTYWKKSKVEDVACGIYKTHDGRMAIITSSWTNWAGYMSLEIIGDKGYIHIHSENKNKLLVGDAVSHKQKVFDFSTLPITSYKDELLDFVKNVQRGIEPRPNATDGAHVVQMIDAVYQSIKLKKHIPLSKIL